MKLIAGIDPGTKVGWAVLDLSGNLIATGSRKELDLDSLVAQFTKLGKVVLIGSDKAKIPGFVQDAATKLGARTIKPQQDMQVREKREITATFEFNNSHEMDAIASAYSAWKKMNHLLSKVQRICRKENRSYQFESIFEIVLKKKISIRAALASVEP